MNKWIVVLFILVATISGLFFNSYKRVVAPPCMNADEAAFAYNAYSIAKTGKDEYGAVLPLRLKSFGDYKMPLYSYLSVPFVSVFGLNQTSGRAVNIVLSVLFPLIVYLLVVELIDRKDVGILAGFLVAASLGLNILGRHTHEAYLSAFMTATTLMALVRVIKKGGWGNVLMFYVAVVLLLFSYHPGRLFAFYFLVAYIYFSFFSVEGVTTSGKTKIWFAGGFLLIFVLFLSTDVLYKPDRIKNLLFFNNAGFSLRINELRGEGGSPFIYNKLTVGVRDIFARHLVYFSPQFLAVDGDGNDRFGYPGMAPMTVAEYVLGLIGLYFLYKNNERFRHLLLGVLLIAPLSGSLSWADVSLSRALFLFVPWLILSAYGAVYLTGSLAVRYRYIAILLIFGVELAYLGYSWDFYFNHYPKRARTIRAWQCGYEGVGELVKSKYNQVDRFYITKKNGEPYIFMLYYLNYPPEKYQSQASLSAPDEYGFGQVERFDKFEFNFSLPQQGRYVAIGYPDDFNAAPSEIRAKISKITVGTEQIFWVYDSTR